MDNMDHADRIILLLNADSFEVQVYQQHEPSSRGKPCVVTNSFGRILAANIEAKYYGISCDDLTFPNAKLKYDALVNIKIPEKSNTPELVLQRKATAEIVNEIQKFCQEQKVGSPIFQYSSHDEFYLDVTSLIGIILNANGKRFPTHLISELWPKSIIETPNGVVVASEFRSNKLNEIKLFYGLVLGSMIVQRVKDSTGFLMSVGIGGNKLIAKLGCGLNKPTGATLVLPYSISEVGRKIKVADVPGLGGKLGETIKASLGVKTMYDLSCYRVDDISNVRLNGTGGIIGTQKAQEFYNCVHGLCNEKVVEKIGPDSLLTSKEYRSEKYGFTQLIDEIRSLIKTILQRADEELQWKHRVAMSLKLTVRRYPNSTISGRLSYPIETQNADEILDMFLELLRLDDEWDEVRDRLTKMELQAQPFSQANA